MANAMRFAELDLATAVEMASRRPLELLGREAPSLEAGSAADLVLFDLPGAAGDRPLGEIDVQATIVAGERVFDVGVAALHRGPPVDRERRQSPGRA